MTQQAKPHDMDMEELYMRTCQAERFAGELMADVEAVLTIWRKQRDGEYESDSAALDALEGPIEKLERYIDPRA